MTLIENTKDLRVGQLLKHSWLTEDKSSVSWEYVVIKYIFDDEVVVINKYGRLTAITIDNESAVGKLNNKARSTDYVYKLLFQNGEPVMSKRNFFGKYTFKPDLLEV